MSVETRTKENEEGFLTDDDAECTTPLKMVNNLSGFENYSEKLKNTETSYNISVGNDDWSIEDTVYY